MLNSIRVALRRVNIQGEEERSISFLSDDERELDRHRRESSQNTDKEESHSLLHDQEEANTSIEEATHFILKFVHTLQSSGAPSDKVEEKATTLSNKLGVEASFLVFPTAIVASFEKGATHLINTSPSTNCEKLLLANDLSNALVRGNFQLCLCSPPPKQRNEEHALY